MNPLAETTKTLSDAAALAEDRRWNERTKFVKHIRIYRMGTLHGEEVGTAIPDVSRDGAYFTAQSHDYWDGIAIDSL